MCGGINTVEHRNTRATASIFRVHSLQVSIRYTETQLKARESALQRNKNPPLLCISSAVIIWKRIQSTSFKVRELTLLMLLWKAKSIGACLDDDDGGRTACMLRRSGPVYNSVSLKACHRDRSPGHSGFAYKLLLLVWVDQVISERIVLL